MEGPILVMTADGSHTLLHPELNEHYHSINGAIRESSHIFIENGLMAVKDRTETIKVLEVGFGTGLNVLLTFLEARKQKMRIQYVGVEPNPLGEATLAALNYPGLVGSCNERILFTSIHRAPWDSPVYLDDDFILFKLSGRIQDVKLQPGQFDVIYFDAFSPKVDPALWTREVFLGLYESLAAGGLLLTYSASGAVRRSMKEAGFIIESLPGPPGKREITRAEKRA